MTHLEMANEFRRERDALAADLAKYQQWRVFDVEEKNWLRDRVQALEAALNRLLADLDARRDIGESVANAMNVLLKPTTSNRDSEQTPLK